MLKHSVHMVFQNDIYLNSMRESWRPPPNHHMATKRKIRSLQKTNEARIDPLSPTVVYSEHHYIFNTRVSLHNYSAGSPTPHDLYMYSYNFRGIANTRMPIIILCKVGWLILYESFGCTWLMYINVKIAYFHLCTYFIDFNGFFKAIGGYLYRK